VVWRSALTDVMRVAPNLPGAGIAEDAGDGSFKGEFTVRIGPATAAYNGALKLEHLDEKRHVATMSARGSDKRGNGGATAKNRLARHRRRDGRHPSRRGDGLRHHRQARPLRPRRHVQEVANRLLREFAANLVEDLARDEPGGASARDGVAGTPSGAGGAVAEPVAAASSTPAASPVGSAATSDAVLPLRPRSPFRLAILPTPSAESGSSWTSRRRA